MRVCAPYTTASWSHRNLAYSRKCIPSILFPQPLFCIQSSFPHHPIFHPPVSPVLQSFLTFQPGGQLAWQILAYCGIPLHGVSFLYAEGYVAIYFRDSSCYSANFCIRTLGELSTKLRISSIYLLAFVKAQWILFYFTKVYPIIFQIVKLVRLREELCKIFR